MTSTILIIHNHVQYTQKEHETLSRPYYFEQGEKFQNRGMMTAGCRQEAPDQIDMSQWDNFERDKHTAQESTISWMWGRSFLKK